MSAFEFIERDELERQIEVLKLEKERDRLKLLASTTHNRVLWFSITVITVINLIFAWGAVRHMKLWH
jgi:hypothetical protein